MNEPRADPPAGASTPADPRATITRDVYRLAPELLGTPLASPWRRGVAAAIDGLLIAILSSASAVLFGFAAALVLFRVSGRPAPGGYIRSSVRFVLRAAGGLVLFVMVVIAWDAVEDRLEDRTRSDDSAAESSPDDAPVALSGAQGVQLAADIPLFYAAQSEARARELAERLVPALRAGGMEDRELGGIMDGFRNMGAQPWRAAIADSVLSSLDPDSGAEDEVVGDHGEAAVLAYADALARGDTLGSEELRAAAAAAIAADTIEVLHEEIEEREQRREAAVQRAERLQTELAREPGIMGMLSALADDLGLGLGWAGLYFTTFTTLWKGRTPGKRLMKIRVIRLDGQQMGWWAAFERFGGYAAGVATGLLGFAQIFWDRNRQAVQDKISETVVIRDERRRG